MLGPTTGDELRPVLTFFCPEILLFIFLNLWWNILKYILSSEKIWWTTVCLSTPFNKFQYSTIFVSFVLPVTTYTSSFDVVTFILNKSPASNTDSLLGRITIGPVGKGWKMRWWDGFPLIYFYGRLKVPAVPLLQVSKWTLAKKPFQLNLLGNSK